MNDVTCGETASVYGNTPSNSRISLHQEKGSKRPKVNVCQIHAWDQPTVYHSFHPGLDLYSSKIDFKLMLKGGCKYF